MRLQAPCQNQIEPLRQLAPEPFKEDMRLFTGMLWAFTTAGAVLVAMMGSSCREFREKSEPLMWVVVAVSLAAFLYLAQVPP